MNLEGLFFHEKFVHLMPDPGLFLQINAFLIKWSQQVTFYFSFEMKIGKIPG